jgi:hypothetical protein
MLLLGVRAPVLFVGDQLGWGLRTIRCYAFFQIAGSGVGEVDTGIFLAKIQMVLSGSEFPQGEIRCRCGSVVGRSIL